MTFVMEEKTEETASFELRYIIKYAPEPKELSRFTMKLSSSILICLLERHFQLNIPSADFRILSSVIILPAKSPFL